MSENYIQMIGQDKIYPIIRCKEASQTIEIAKALVEGGIRVLEINVENPSIYEAIREVSKFANVCAGGIITSMQADAALECGAKLFSSPIFQMNMVKISKNKQVPFIAGASTPNEAYDAWKSRIPLIKIFPVIISSVLVLYGLNNLEISSTSIVLSPIFKSLDNLVDIY